MAEPLERDQDSWLEARLDLLLGQELHSDRELLAWVLEQAGDHGRPHEIAAVVVRFNVDERGPDIPVDAHGETDIRVDVRLADGGRRTVLIEDKVWARFQPRQPERYRLRADAVAGVTVIVAPRSYLTTREGVQAFDVRLAIEDLAAWLRSRGDRRGSWTAEQLDELVASRRREPKPDHEGTAAFTDFCIAWFVEHAAHLIPQRGSMHTAGTGWLWFETPNNLVCKVVGWVKQPDAAVDLHLASTRLVDVHQARAALGANPLPGFRVATDSHHNLLLRHPLPKLNPALGPPTEPAQQRTLDDALHACVEAAE